MRKGGKHIRTTRKTIRTPLYSGVDRAIDIFGGENLKVGKTNKGNFIIRVKKRT